MKKCRRGSTYLLLIVFIATIITSCNKTETVVPKTPTVTWSNPDAITSGTPLSKKQLNAIVDIPGTFVYTPTIGTVLNYGTNQDLKVDFTPTDVAYSSATKTVQIDVILINGGFEILNNNGFVMNWMRNNETEIKIDSITKRSGKYSVSVSTNRSTSVGEITLKQLILGSKMEKGKMYSFGFWMKNNAMETGMLFWINILGNFNTQLFYESLNGPRNYSDWKLYEYDFIPALSETIYSYTVTFDFQRTSYIGQDPTSPLMIWLDDFYIREKD